MEDDNVRDLAKAIGESAVAASTAMVAVMVPLIRALHARGVLNEIDLRNLFAQAALTLEQVPENETWLARPTLERIRTILLGP